jgi:hypothetical protein
MSVESILCALYVALNGRPSQIYSEEAFRYLLAIERARAKRSSGCFLLALVDVRGAHGTSGRMAPAVAAKVFLALSRSVRDMDFIGWFREGRVAAAVLAPGLDPIAPDVPRQIGQRITAMLRDHRLVPIAGRVRVLRVQPALKR